MNWIYLDISGSLEEHPAAIIGLVWSPGDRAPASLMKIPRDANAQVKAFFGKAGEFKFSEMVKGKSRVRQFLAERLVAIANEPSLQIICVIVRKGADIDGHCCLALGSGSLDYGDVKIIADNGTLEKFKYLMRIRGTVDGRDSFLLGLSRADEAVSMLHMKAQAEKHRFVGPSFSLVSIGHERSHDIEGIQIADLVAGAAFRKVVRNDSSWFDLIKKKATLVEIFG